MTDKRAHYDKNGELIVETKPEVWTDLSQGKHTVQPWVTATLRANAAGFGWFITTTGGAKVAHVLSGRKDQEFIVRACNAHDDLVAALRGLLEFVEERGQSSRVGIIDCRISDARAALKRAE